jgi:hypothetical protein
MLYGEPGGGRGGQEQRSDGPKRKPRRLLALRLLTVLRRGPAEVMIDRHGIFLASLSNTTKVIRHRSEGAALVPL